MALFADIASAGTYFVLDVSYMLGSATFNSIGLIEIDKEVGYAGKSGFLIKVVSFEGADIKAFHYNMSEGRNHLIYIPFSKNAARVEMYTPINSKIMDIDVSSFSDTCGNQLCEVYESYESCTKDCGSGNKDNFCDGAEDGICDPDCTPKTDADCAEGKINQSAAGTGQRQVKFKEAEKSSYLAWLPVFAAALVVLLLLFIRKRKDSIAVGSLRRYINENLKRGFTMQQIKDALFREGYGKKEIEKAMRGI